MSSRYSGKYSSCGGVMPGSGTSSSNILSLVLSHVTTQFILDGVSLQQSAFTIISCLNEHWAHLEAANLGL